MVWHRIIIFVALLDLVINDHCDSSEKIPDFLL